MNVYKYGITVDRRSRNCPTQWRIALFDADVSGHGFIDVPESLFNFPPTPGKSVKVKFKNERDDMPLVVTRCNEHEWIRDVEVINSQVVIFMIIRFTKECLEKTVQGENNSYHIMQNDDTDFRRVAIPGRIIDNAKRSVSPLQKPDEPKVYRVGVVWDPLVLEGVTVNWRYYNDFPLVPIFELYFRENTLPYLSESMVYGVLEGVVIAKNENGALYWTRGMGCVILPSVTRDSQMPALGFVNYVLARRCLPENSFGFPCCYELLPETRDHKWEGIKIVADEMNRCVYMQLTCECVLSKEINSLAMMIPHIGTVFRGLGVYKNKLSAGNKYNIRIEFQKDDQSFNPVIVDVCLPEDEFVQCRVIHIARETKNYYAVLEPSDSVFEQCKHRIDYIKIPFRVMFCAKEIHVEAEELLVHCFSVRIRRPCKNHDIVSAVHIHDYHESRKDPAFAVLNKTVWLRSMVKKNNYDPNRVIELICPRLEQKIIDPSGLSAKMPLDMTFAVHAQFTLTSENIPVFLVRNVAPTIHQLPRVTSQIAASLPPLRSDTSCVHSSDQSQLSDSLSLSSLSLSEPETLHSEFPSNVLPLLTRQKHRNSLKTESGTDDEDRSNNSLSSGSNKNRTQNSDGVVVTESFLPSSAASTASAVLSSSSSESSTVFIGTPLKPPAIFRSNVDHPSRFNTKSSAPGAAATRGVGFGPSNYSRPGLISNQGTRFLASKPPRRPSVKYGFRQLREPRNHADVLNDIVYKFIKHRPMFVENEREALDSWFRAPTGKVTSAKNNVVYTIPVEIIPCRIEQNKSHPRYLELIRFICLDNVMNVCNASVVVPTGIQFPQLPKAFQLGERFKMDHFSFAQDRMCRFSGFAIGLKQLMFYSEPPSIHISNMRTMETSVGHEYVRFTTKVTRPCEPELESKVFEIWSCEHLPGFVIVEKRRDLLKSLEPLNPDEDESHVYSAVIEPVAGGPMEISILKNFKDADPMDIFVFWRLVIEFSDDVPMPQFLRRKERHKRCRVVVPPRKITEKDHTISKYGMWETLHHNSVLAQEKLDLFRALNDPRVKMIDGPDLKPEIEIRKVHVDSRRKSMIGALNSFLKQLPSLKEHQMFNFVFEEDFIKQLEELIGLDDGSHPTQFKKRTFSLITGLNYMSDLLLRNDVYLKMYEETKFVPLLQEMADCIDLNATYIKQTDDVKKMLLFFRKHRMTTVT